MTLVRKGQIERAMSREEFRERYFSAFKDPAYRAECPEEGGA